MKPSEIVFDVTESPDGSFEAKAIGYSIFTLGDSWDDLKFMVKDAVLCHFDPDEMPSHVDIRVIPTRSPVIPNPPPCHSERSVRQPCHSRSLTCHSEPSPVIPNAVRNLKSQSAHNPPISHSSPPSE